MRSDVGDEDLARAARLGDLGSFRALVERHRGRVFSLALRMCGSREEAEDMAQEAFLKVYRGLPSFRGEAAFTTWMLRVALNTFHRHMRRLRRTRPLPEERAHLERESADPLPDTEVLGSERDERVRRLVGRLPGPFRDAVTLFYLQERSVEEAAAALGVSLGTLKSRLFRARRLLLEAWNQQRFSAAPAAADAPEAAGPPTATPRDGSAPRVDRPAGGMIR